MEIRYFDPSEHCAVVGCEEDSHPHACPYDHRYHRHGSIHFECYQGNELEFRKDFWYWLCNEHYQMCVDELATRRAQAPS